MLFHDKNRLANLIQGGITMKNQTRINQLLTVLLLLCVLFVCMAGTAMAAEECAHVFADGQCTACGVTGGYCGAETDEGGAESVWWTLTDGNSVLTIGGTGAMKDYAIPLDRPWHDSCSGITSLSIGEGVTRIGEDAFVFFEGIESVTIPASVQSLGYRAFVGCAALKTVTFAQGSELTTIDSFAFQNCAALTEITFPAGVVSFNPINTFDGCYSLTDIHVAEGNTTYKSVDGVLYTADGTTLVLYPAGKTAESFTTPAGVTTIEVQAFLSCSVLNEVTIPASVTSIGYNAFDDHNLETVNAPCNWDGSLYTFADTVSVNVAEHTPDENGYTDNGDGTHSLTCTVCGSITEPHTYDDEDGTCVCGAVKTYTITFNPYGDSGAKIVKINDEAKEILHGGTFTAPHGQELKVKFANTLSTQETGVRVSAENADYLVVNFTYNEATNIMTIPAVNQDLYIGADAYVRVQFDLHGGALTDERKENLEENFGCTWDADNSTLKAIYGYSTGGYLSEFFQLDGHTFAGAKVNGSDEIVNKLFVMGDATVDILWHCDGSTLTPVKAKDATCTEAGNIAHYICTCDKLYAEDKTTVLTSVTLPVDPDNHVGMDSTTGKCACGEDMAVATVTTGGEITYYETLQEAMDAANEKTATVKLLADCSFDTVIDLYDGSNVTLNLSGKTITAGACIFVFKDATLTIEGEGNYTSMKDWVDVIYVDGTLNISGGTFSAVGDNVVLLQVWDDGQVNISGGSFTTTGSQSTPVSISCNVTVTGTPTFSGLEERGEFSIVNDGTLDLSGTTPTGWRVRNFPATGGVEVGRNLILPASGYALKLGDQFVTNLSDNGIIGTIVEHKTHNYTTEDYDATHHWTACACGATTEKVNHTFTYTPVTGKEVHIVGCSGCTYTAPEEIPHEFTNGVCVCTAKAVAKVDDTFYVSIHNALRAAEEINGCTLTLLEDITLTSMSSTAAYTNKGTFTLDLNGKTLSSNKGTLSVSGSADLTIKDSAGGGKIISTGSNAIYQTGGKVTIESGTFEGTLDGVFLSGDSTLNVKGGAFVGSRAMITGFGSDCVIDLTAIDPAGFTLKNNGSGTFAPRLPSGYAMVNGSGTVVESLSAEESATVKASLENATVTLSESIFVYDGQPHMPTVTVTLDGRNLTEGTDYQVLYMRARKMTNGEPTQWFGDHTTSDPCVKADKGYYAVIVGMGNYYTADVFTLYKNFVIEPRPLTIKADDQTIPVGGSVDSANFTITEGALVEGHTLTAEVQVADGTLATPGTYTNVLYLDTDSVSIMAGEENVKSNYSITLDTGTLTIVEHIHEWTYTADDEKDTITATCVSTIGACPDAEKTFTLNAPDAVYSGNPVEAEVTSDGADLTYTLHYTGTDYDSTDAPINAGDYTVTMTVGDKSVSTSFTISPKDISVVQSIQFSLAQTSFVYSGEAPELAVNAVDSSVGNYTMQEGTDYTVGTVQVNAGSHKLTVTGMGNYTGSVELDYEITRAPIGAAVIAAEAQVYTGEALEPAFTVTLNGKTLKHNVDFTYNWTNNVNVGEGKIVINGIGNYEGQAEGTFAIAMADAELSVQTDKDLYTYGETVTVTASRVAKPATFALRSAIAPDQMALFLGDTQLGEAVDAVDGIYTMTVNTADKELSIGENTLRVVYVSGGNLKDAEATVTVLLTAKSIEPVLAGSASKAYDGTTTVTDAGNLTINLNGIIAGDTVSAAAAGYVYADETVGQSKTVTANGITLGGADSIFYTLAQTKASAQIGEIKKAMLIGLTAPVDTTLDVYCADADAVIGKLPDTVVYHLADGKKVDLKVEWSCTAYDSTPGEANTFAWAVSDSELACYEIVQNVADDGTVIVTNSAFLPVTVTGTDTAITYNGTAYDVTQMFAIDSNAGAAVFEIIGGGTGEGTLNGSVLTITKAGTITIKVTTAPNAAYAAGEATAVLTISKGTPAVTIPAGLTAWYGQKISDIALPTVDGGAWSWTDTNSTVGDAGVQTHQAIFTPADTNLWNITTHPVNITVAQAGTSFSDMKVYNGDTESTTFTYGETITVKAEATAVQPAVFSLRSLIAPARHQMALFIRNADGSEVQISEAVNEQNGIYTMTYNTAGKALKIGDNALIAKFVGDENMADYQETVLVTLNPKELGIASLTAQDRVYEPGNQQVTITGAEVSGKADANDDVSVLIDGMTATISSENVGTYDTALIPQDVSLTGNHAGYYFARGNVSVSIPQGVEITQATPYTASGTPAQPVFDPIYQDGQTLVDIPVSLPAGTFNVPGTIEWEAPGDTPVTEGTPFTWVFTPDDPNWKPVTGTVVIYPDGEPPVITAPAGDQEVTVYEGEQGTMVITAADATSYQWYINRYDGLGYVPISGATSASYTTSVVNLDNDGFTYYCVASNAYGNAESPVFLLQVLEKIEVPETGDESNIALWTALMLLSIAGLTIITMNGRRSKITR